MPLPICAPFGCCASHFETHAATASPPLEPLEPLEPLLEGLPLVPEVVVPELELEPDVPELELGSPLDPLGSESPEQPARTETQHVREVRKARLASMRGLRVRSGEQPPYRTAPMVIARRKTWFTA
jgi:hypothetical protein